MGAVNHFRVFVGPKDYDLLKRVDPKLEQVVNFGWLSILAKPLFLIVNWFNDNVVHNFGWAIVVVTIVINLALFPLKLSNMKSMRKMQALKPQIDAINAKYKNIKMTDPRKADQNQEVMDLYKKYGVNPMGGCVPMLMQIPFFFAFYKVFTVSVEMRGASWLWVTDLVAAGDPPHQHPAHRHDRQPVLHAEHDAAGQRRSQSAEDDDVHAADLRFHVLQLRPAAWCYTT
jgi:YidC/Oxa1 family membrane protein insertase